MGLVGGWKTSTSKTTPPTPAKWLTINCGLGTGRIIIHVLRMSKAKFCILTGPRTKGNSRRVNTQVKARSRTAMGSSTRANSKRENSMGRAATCTLTRSRMRGSGRITDTMGMASKKCKMARCTMVLSKRVRSMGKAHLYGPMATSTLGNGRKTRSMVKVCTPGLTAASSRDHT